MLGQTYHRQSGMFNLYAYSITVNVEVEAAVKLNNSGFKT